ncbi:MAG: hypothetical protein ACK58Q_15535, partial [Chitinophagales bacterium]
NHSFRRLLGDKRNFNEMKMRLIFSLLLISILSCQQKRNLDLLQNPIYFDLGKTSEIVKSTQIKPEEYFVDSTTFGRKAFSKIEIFKYRVSTSDDDSVYGLIRFYSLRNKIWTLKNEFQYQKDGLTELDIEISDYNNDKYKDITFASAIAARGANEVRQLIIYDKKKDEIVFIKNSAYYPNLKYNSTLNCLDAMLCYGVVSTVLLEISGDSLLKFASVDVADGLSVSEYDKNGNEKLIYEDSIYKGEFPRFKNFKPIIEYGQEEYKLQL